MQLAPHGGMCTPKGIRTPVAALKGPSPGPLDDRGIQGDSSNVIPIISRPDTALKGLHQTC